MPTILLPPLPQAIPRPASLGMRRLQRVIGLIGRGQTRDVARLAFNRLVLPRLAAIGPADRTTRALDTIFAQEAGRPVIVMGSTADWHTPQKHRPQHLAAALARAGATVFYASARTGYDTLMGVRQLAPHLYLADLTDELLARADRPIVMLLSTDVRVDDALVASLTSRGARVVYDYIDHFDAAVTLLPISAARRATHEWLLRHDEIPVVASAQALFDDVHGCRARARKVFLVTNGVDDTHYCVTRQERRFRAPFGEALARGRPVVGYFGLLASWVDVELIAAVARARPELTVVTIGADFDGAGALLASLRPSNLFLVPSVPYEELPHYAAWFDVSMLPFRQSAVTTAASPLKLFEYMAVGAPIVSTAIPEAMRYRSVTVAWTADEFIDACVRAIGQPDASSDRDARVAEARANSWDVRAAELIAGLSAAGYLSSHFESNLR